MKPIEEIPFLTTHLNQWVKKNKNALLPPVNNKILWEGKDFIVMIIGGPNQRKDFHVNEGEEFFYQMKGNISLRIMTENGPKDLSILEGETYLLKALIPHSPQRPPHSIGMVIERKRNPGEKDGFIWYCEKCNSKLYEKYIILKNIETQLPKIFKSYAENKKFQHCKKCGFINE